MSLAFITGRAPIAINSLQPADNSLSIGPGTAKTFRFSCREIDAVMRLPLFFLASTINQACDIPAIILFLSTNWCGSDGVSKGYSETIKP